MADISAFADGGAAVTTINERFAEMLGCTLIPRKEPFGVNSYAGGGLGVRKYTLLLMKITGLDSKKQVASYVIPVNAQVTQADTTLLLGSDFLSTHKVLSDHGGKQMTFFKGSSKALLVPWLPFAAIQEKYNHRQQLRSFIGKLCCMDTKDIFLDNYIDYSNVLNSYESERFDDEYVNLTVEVDVMASKIINENKKPKSKIPKSQRPKPKTTQEHMDDQIKKLMKNPFKSLINMKPPYTICAIAFLLLLYKLLHLNSLPTQVKELTQLVFKDSGGTKGVLEYRGFPHWCPENHIDAFVGLDGTPLRLDDNVNRLKTLLIV